MYKEMLVNLIIAVESNGKLISKIELPSDMYLDIERRIKAEMFPDIPKGFFNIKIANIDIVRNENLNGINIIFQEKEETRNLRQEIDEIKKDIRFIKDKYLRRRR